MNRRMIFLLGAMSILTITVLILSLSFKREGHLSLSSPDRVEALPGQPKGKNLNQFAGYVQVDDKQERPLFYYLVEAEQNADEKPLILWLAGGPGCSSVGVGAFTEHGPFRPTPDALVLNEFSRTKETNLFYVDTLARVGFSYSKNATFYHVNDEITALDNLIFLKKWVAKHPEYEQREFFIAGEDYAGNLGNPMLDFVTAFNYRADYMWLHGQIYGPTYGLLQTVCNYSTIRRQYHLFQNLSEPCLFISQRMWNESGKSVNPHNIANSLCGSSSPTLPVAKVGESGSIDPCLKNKVISYLDRKDVQKAPHARVGQWSMCTNPTVVEFDKQDYLASMIPHIKALIRSTNISILIYSGDQDSVLTFLGTRFLVERLVREMVLRETQPYQPWFHGREVGGWTMANQKLSFATIKGGGHQPPYDKPELSLALLHWHLQGKPLPNEPYDLL